MRNMGELKLAYRHAEFCNRNNVNQQSCIFGSPVSLLLVMGRGKGYVRFWRWSLTILHTFLSVWLLRFHTFKLLLAILSARNFNENKCPGHGLLCTITHFCISLHFGHRIMRYVQPWENSLSLNKKKSFLTVGAVASELFYPSLPCMKCVHWTLRCNCSWYLLCKPDSTGLGDPFTRVDTSINPDRWPVGSCAKLCEK